MRWSFRTNGNFRDFVHTDETSLAVESIIFSLHYTSRPISWSLLEDINRISFSIDEVEYQNILITDIDFDGVVMDSNDDFETGIKAMFPGYRNVSGGDGMTILSDWWNTVDGNDFIEGASTGETDGTQYTLQATDKVLMVDLEGIIYKISPTLGNMKCKLDLSNNKILFPLFFNGTQSVGVLFKRA
jgi:hypothetical protein